MKMSKSAVVYRSYIIPSIHNPSKWGYPKIGGQCKSLRACCTNPLILTCKYV